MKKQQQWNRLQYIQKSKEQTKAFEQLAKAFNLFFEVVNEPSIEYEAMLKESYQQAKEGKREKIAIENF